MGEGCEGRKSKIDSNNNVWAIRKKVELKIRKWESADNKVWAIHKKVGIISGKSWEAK